MKKKYIAKVTLGHAGAFLDERESVQTLSQAIEKAEAVGDNDKHQKLISFRSALRPGDAPEAIQTNPEDIYLVPFRLLSATVVGAGSWKATFFPENVLRESMPLLLNKPIYRNHWMDPDYWLGTVREVSWTQSYNQGNIMVPSGIDGLLAIDTSTQMNADLAKGINNGAVRSNSVTVEFEWEPSHDFEFEWQFWETLGTMVDGRMVTRVVTRILDYHETSIVGLGADPFAKQIGEDGNLIDIDRANSDGLEVAERTFENEGERAEFIKLAKSNSFNLDCEPENNFLQLSKTDKMAKKKIEFATGFGAGLHEAINEYCSNKELSRGDVKTKLAEAVGVSVRTVELYVSGKNACPTLEYIGEWAKVLEIEPGDLVTLAQEDGCAFDDAELKTLLGDSYAKDEDEDEDEEEEMSAGKDEGDEEEMSASAELVQQLQQQLAAMQEQIQQLTAGIKTPEPPKEPINPPGQPKVEKIENDKGGDDEKTPTVTTLEGEVKTIVETYKKEAENAKAEQLAQKAAYKEAMDKKAAELSVLRAELEELKNETERLRKEKAAVELESAEVADLRLSLEEKTEQAEQLSQQLESYKGKEHFTKIGQDYFAKAKAEATRLYRATFGNAAKDSVIALFEKAKDLETINALVEQYGKQLGNQFEYKCKNCGGKDLEFGSVIVGANTGEIMTGEPIKTDDDIRHLNQWKD